jgi:hypothetical protein
MGCGASKKQASGVREEPGLLTSDVKETPVEKEAEVLPEKLAEVSAVVEAPAEKEAEAAEEPAVSADVGGTDGQDAEGQKPAVTFQEETPTTAT